VPDNLSWLVLLACPLGMGLMMLFMMRGHGAGENTPHGEELGRLRSEVDQLRSQLEDRSPQRSTDRG
jgi:hypothetical protein